MNKARNLEKILIYTLVPNEAAYKDYISNYSYRKNALMKMNSSQITVFYLSWYIKLFLSFILSLSSFFSINPSSLCCHTYSHKHNLSFCLSFLLFLKLSHSFFLFHNLLPLSFLFSFNPSFSLCSHTLPLCIFLFPFQSYNSLPFFSFNPSFSLYSHTFSPSFFFSFSLSVLLFPHTFTLLLTI